MMIHWCLLDKECRPYTWMLHFEITGKYHYQLPMPYDPHMKQWFPEMSAWHWPKLSRRKVDQEARALARANKETIRVVVDKRR